jgi:hypothetical protein
MVRRVRCLASHSKSHQTQVLYREPAMAGFHRYYNNRSFSDLTIVAPDGQKIHVHRVGKEPLLYVQLEPLMGGDDATRAM